jgi:hypothetical protein
MVVVSGSVEKRFKATGVDFDIRLGIELNLLTIGDC